jgi:hypothetical protein
MQGWCHKGAIIRDYIRDFIHFISYIVGDFMQGWCHNDN